MDLTRLTNPGEVVIPKEEIVVVANSRAVLPLKPSSEAGEPVNLINTSKTLLSEVTFNLS